jgi:hypothetical protein
MFILFWDMMQTVFSRWEEHNGLQKHSRLLRTLNLRNYDGWNTINEPRSRSILINEIMSPNWSQLRATIYTYHRAGLDNLFNQDQSQEKSDF